jgi:hypothetical protein
MANSFFRLSDNAFNNFPCPAAVLRKWNVPAKPTEDEEGNALEVTPYLIREALDAASLGSAPYFPIVHLDGFVPERIEEGATHWIVPLNNVGGIIDSAVMPVAQAEGTPYSEVKLAHDECKHYLATGELPS